jgi:hypothetical protein
VKLYTIYRNDCLKWVSSDCLNEFWTRILSMSHYCNCYIINIIMIGLHEIFTSAKSFYNILLIEFTYLKVTKKSRKIFVSSSWFIPHNLCIELLRSCQLSEKHKTLMDSWKHLLNVLCLLQMEMRFLKSTKYPVMCMFIFNLTDVVYLI